MTQANEQAPVQGESPSNSAHQSELLLARNAKVIFALNELCKSRKGVTPTQLERDLWLEAYRNLATVVAGVAPKDLLGNGHIQPYLDWAWKSGVIPSPYLGHPRPTLRCQHVSASATKPPNPLFEAGMEGGDARCIPAPEGFELTRDIAGAGGGDGNGEGDGDGSGHAAGVDEATPGLAAESASDAFFVSTGIVNVVSPLARGPGTSPVIVGGDSYAGVPDGK